MRPTSLTARLAAVGVTFTTLALAGAAGAASSTLFAIGNVLTDSSGQPITLVAKRSPTDSVPTVLAQATLRGPI